MFSVSLRSASVSVALQFGVSGASLSPPTLANPNYEFKSHYRGDNHGRGLVGLGHTNTVMATIQQSITPYSSTNLKY
jgi:hypothetical protein